MTIGFVPFLLLGGALGWMVAWGTATPYLWPVWTIILLAAGLLLRIIWLGTSVCLRHGPDDTPIWRMTRACILVTLAPALERILLTREIGEGPGRHRLLAAEFDPILDRIEPMAGRLRASATLADLPGFGNRLMVELAIYTSAAHRVLLDAGIPPSDARSVIADAGWIVYSGMLRLTSLPFRWTSRDPATRLRRTIRTLLWFPFHAPGAPGYAVDVRTDRDGIRTHFTHCPPQTFVRNLAATDDRDDLLAFRQSWCRYDWPGADLIANDGRRGHYTRPHTLSHGDSVCDMCWLGRRSAPETGGTSHNRATQGDTT
ncbi:hypothetical protein [Pseudaestuariivita atlantica]|uniref:Uncharacterized protein n=1 Tax=Pseudaestuariivita atlantica TaxID=1317121 RepID=A0A0L1JS58_9RHOB|nr:hypothetical protein [Pseudaestuariivita atlantica]KNG94571.1 hypothetical protein ATO11_03960 [Pseudaestuariivita atlantica]